MDFGCVIHNLLFDRVHIFSSIILSDMWAMGAIMAEMFTLRPLFPGSRSAYMHAVLYAHILLVFVI